MCYGILHWPPLNEMLELVSKMVLKGQGFSRAKEAQRFMGLLAAEGWFSFTFAPICESSFGDFKIASRVFQVVSESI